LFEAKHVLSADELEDFEASHPPLPGHKVHSCTDVAWLLVFLVCLGAWGRVAARDAPGFVSSGLGLRGLCQRQQKFSLRRLARPPLKTYWCIPYEGNGGVQNGTGGNGTQAEICAKRCSARSVADDICGEDSVAHMCIERRPITPAMGCKVQLGRYLGTTIRDPRDLAELEAFCPKGKRAKSLVSVPAAVSVIVPLEILVACAAGYFFLYVFRKFARVIVLVVQYAYLGGLVITAFFFFPSTIQELISNPQGRHLIGIGLLVLAFFSWVVIRIMRRRFLDAAVGCIQATCVCILDEPACFVQPVSSLLLKVVFFTIVAFAVLKDLGDEILPVMIGGDLELEKFPYHFLLTSVWVYEMGVHIREYALVWVAQFWYFTPYVDGQKQNKPSFTLLKAYCNMFRYHLGTAALGSLLRPLLLPWQLLTMALPDPQSDDRQNSVTKCLLSCCYCCIACHRFCKVFTSPLAYMDVCLSSSGFSTAARRAHLLMSEESRSTAWLKKATHHFFAICGNLFMGSVCAITAYLAVRRFGVAVDEQTLMDTRAHWTVVKQVTIASGIVGLLVGANFTRLLCVLGLAIEYCVALERRRRENVSDARGKYARNSGMNGLFRPWPTRPNCS